MPNAAESVSSAPPTNGKMSKAASTNTSELQTSMSETICLDQFLKLAGIAATGGQAKLMIQGGEVLVNGSVETRRRRKLTIGDSVAVAGEILVVEEDPETPSSA